MGDYFSHWLQFGRTIPNPPRIFGVNWFHKDQDRKFIWPGYGENMRILNWIIERANGRAISVESPIGWMPRYEDLDRRGNEDFTPEQFLARPHSKITAISRAKRSAACAG
jgi:phosphoenolpyruvate carboxykinase (GTP)